MSDGGVARVEIELGRVDREVPEVDVDTVDGDSGIVGGGDEVDAMENPPSSVHLPDPTSTLDGPLVRLASFKLDVVTDIEVERGGNGDVVVIPGISVVVVLGREGELERCRCSDSTRRLPLDNLEDGPELGYPNPILEPVMLVGKLPTTGLSNGVLVLPSPKLELARESVRGMGGVAVPHVGVGLLRPLDDPGGVGDLAWDVREDVDAVDVRRAMMGFLSLVVKRTFLELNFPITPSQ